METNAKNLKLTPELIQAVRLLFVAQAHTGAIRPVVIGYQTEILRQLQGPSQFTGKIITDPKDSYELREDDFTNFYLPRCKEEQAKAGLVTPSPDHCPLLVAESLERDAQRNIIVQSEYITGISLESLISHIGLYRQMVDAVTDLVCNYCNTKGIELNLLKVGKETV